METLDLLFAALAKVPALVSILLHRSHNEWREVVGEVELLVYRPRAGELCESLIFQPSILKTLADMSTPHHNTSAMCDENKDGYLKVLFC